MIIQRKPPRYPRRGPSCLLVIFVIFGIAVSLYVIQNAEEVRSAIIPTPTAEPTRSATEFAVLAELSRADGSNDEAIGFYEQAIAGDATNPEFYIRIVDLLVRQNRSQDAVARAEQATVLDPENDAVWTAAAAAYMAEGDRLSDLGDTNAANLQYANAVQAARKAITINPNNATALAYAAGGTVLQGDPDKYEQAQLFADDAVRIDPNNAIARYYMATVFTYQGRYTEAAEQYQLGLETDPTNTDLYIGLAYNFYGTGNTSEAILTFEDALAVDPETPRRSTAGPTCSCNWATPPKPKRTPWRQCASIPTLPAPRAAWARPTSSRTTTPTPSSPWKRPSGSTAAPPN